MRITTADFAAANVTPKSVDQDGSFALGIDETNNKGVYVGFDADLQDAAGWARSGSQLAQTVPRPGGGWTTRLIPYTFQRGPLVGWYAEPLIQAGIHLFNWDQVAALEGGASYQDDLPGQILQAAETAIEDLIDKYGRPGVPDRYVMVDAFSTLAGHIASVKAFANAEMQRLGTAVVPYPEAVGAFVGHQAKNYPPPAGRIAVGVGDVPIGVPINPSFNYPTNYPWPAGSYSAWTPPVDSWNGTEGPAPSYRHPTPVLWWGPKAGFTNPQTGLPVDEEQPPTDAPYPDPTPGPSDPAPGDDVPPVPVGDGTPPPPPGTTIPPGPPTPPVGGDGNGPLGPPTTTTGLPVGGPVSTTPPTTGGGTLPSLSPVTVVALAAGLFLLFTRDRRR